MLMIGCDKHLGSPAYFLQPGLTHSSTLWLCEQGIKVIGINTYSLEGNVEATTKEFRAKPIVIASFPRRDTRYQGYRESDGKCYDECSEAVGLQ